MGKKAENILKIEIKADPHKKDRIIKDKESEMRKAAKNLEFELAAILRDQIKMLKQGMPS